MKKCIAVTAVALVLLLCACTSVPLYVKDAPEATPVPTATPEAELSPTRNEITETVVAAPSEAPAAFAAVLTGEMQFYDADANAYRYYDDLVCEYSEDGEPIFDEYDGFFIPGGFMLRDLNGDDVPELLLEQMAGTGGSWIFRYINGEVCANYRWYRSMYGITESGFFCTSSGAGYSSYSMARFIGRYFEYENIYELYLESDDIVYHYLYDEPYDADSVVLQAIMERLDNEPWVDFQEYSLDALLQEIGAVETWQKPLGKEKQAYLDDLAYLFAPEYDYDYELSFEENEARYLRSYEGWTAEMRRVLALLEAKLSDAEYAAIVAGQASWTEAMYTRVEINYEGWLNNEYTPDYAGVARNALLGDLTCRRTLRLIDRYFEDDFYDVLAELDLGITAT